MVDPCKITWQVSSNLRYSKVAAIYFLDVESQFGLEGSFYIFRSVMKAYISIRGKAPYLLETLILGAGKVELKFVLI